MNHRSARAKAEGYFPKYLQPGYLLSRLDTKTLSMVEIAYVLKLLGFNKDIFLEFAGYSTKTQAMRSFLQEAYEEGPNMYNFAKNMLLLLDWTDS